MMQNLTIGEGEIIQVGIQFVCVISCYATRTNLNMIIVFFAMYVSYNIDWDNISLSINVL